MSETKTQYGVELEGYLLDEHGIPVPRIEGISSAQWILEHPPEGLRRDNDLTVEELSVMLEGKSKPHDTLEAAMREVLGIKERVNEMLKPRGIRWTMVPVVPHAFEIIPSLDDPNVHQVADVLGGCRKRDEELIAAGKPAVTVPSLAIASLQINQSPFGRVEHNWDLLLEAMRRTLNYIRHEAGNLIAHNDPRHVNFMGWTREQAYCDGIVGPFRTPKFEKAGLPTGRKITVPDLFANVREMAAWICAHQGLTPDDLEQMADKKVYGYLAKPKLRAQPPLIELRVLDSREDEAALAVCRAMEPLLRDIELIVAGVAESREEKDCPVSRRVSTAHRGSAARVALRS